MAWVLRPFVGSAGRTTFFRPEAWGNAYVRVGELVWDSVGRGPRDRPPAALPSRPMPSIRKATTQPSDASNGGGSGGRSY